MHITILSFNEKKEVGSSPTVSSNIYIYTMHLFLLILHESERERDLKLIEL